MNRESVYFPSSVQFIILALTATAAVREARGECWDTGCQPDRWLVRGCEQYDGMTEIKRTACGKNSGHVYTCCYQSNSIDPSRRLCWATGCTSNYSAAARPGAEARPGAGATGASGAADRGGDGGCSLQYPGTVEVERYRCDRDRGYAYFCCNNTNGPSDAVQLNKIGHLTYYSLGLTACGQVYADGDMVAAIAFDHFRTPNPNLDPVCGKRVKIVDPTTLKYIVVTVRDKCEGCKTNDIDVSPSAFEKLKPKIVGRIKVVWDFI